MPAHGTIVKYDSDKAPQRLQKQEKIGIEYTW